jgi:hypothetical protein
MVPAGAGQWQYDPPWVGRPAYYHDGGGGSKDIMSSAQSPSTSAILVGAAVALLVGSVVVALAVLWWRDRCTVNADCAQLCGNSSYPCMAQCEKGRCKKTVWQCQGAANTWCPLLGRCINPLTESCTANAASAVVGPPAAATSLGVSAMAPPVVVAPPTVPAVAGGAVPETGMTAAVEQALDYLDALRPPGQRREMSTSDIIHCSRWRHSRSSVNVVFAAQAEDGRRFRHGQTYTLDKSTGDLQRCEPTTAGAASASAPVAADLCWQRSGRDRWWRKTAAGNLFLLNGRGCQVAYNPATNEYLLKAGDSAAWTQAPAVLRPVFGIFSSDIAYGRQTVQRLIGLPVGLTPAAGQQQALAPIQTLAPVYGDPWGGR